MPLYDYRCSKGHTFEAVGSYNTGETACMICNRIAKRIILQAPGIIYNAPGFTLRADVQPARNDQELGEQQMETRKEMHKRGWNEERLYTEIRKGMRENKETSKKELVTASLPQTVDKHGKEV